MNMAGRWSLSATGATSCKMTFGASSPDATEGTIAPGGGCPFNFFTSRKWNYTEAGAITMRKPWRSFLRPGPAALKARPMRARKSRCRVSAAPKFPRLGASVNFRRTLQRCFQLLEAEILSSRDLQNGRLAAAA